MLYTYNHGFYFYVCDKFKRAYFKSVSRKACTDFINGMGTAKQLPEVIQILN